jgi:hypothetical protein
LDQLSWKKEPNGYEPNVFESVTWMGGLAFAFADEFADRFPTTNCHWSNQTQLVTTN